MDGFTEVQIITALIAVLVASHAAFFWVVVSLHRLERKIDKLDERFSWLVWWSARFSPSIRPPRCAAPNTSCGLARPRFWSHPKRASCSTASTKTVVGLRDRALIGLLVFTFARIGAALGMTVADVYWQHRRLWVRLHEKGGKAHTMPCHHNLETYLQYYIDVAAIADDREGPLFRTAGALVF